MPTDREQNLYYLCLSGVQKAIRRNRVDIAVKNAAVAHSIFPRQTFTRLWTILGEDCCRNKAGLRKFYDWRGNNGNFEDIVPLVKALAEGVKSNDGSSIMALVADDNDDITDRSVYDLFKSGQQLEKFGPIFLKTHQRLRDFADEGPGATGKKEDKEFRFDEIYDLFDFAYGDEWILDVCQKSLYFDRETQLWGTPILHSKAGLSDELLEVTNDPSEFELLEGIIPLSAIDSHTRPGGMALNIFIRKHGDKVPIQKNRMREFVFWNDAWRKDNLCRYQTDWQALWIRAIHEGFLIGPTARTIFDEYVQGPLYEIRKWVMTKTDEYGGLAVEAAKIAKECGCGF